MPILPAVLLTAVSALIAYCATWLSSDGLPNKYNMIIAATATVLLAILTAWMTGWTTDLRQNILLILTTWILFLHQIITLLQTAHVATSPLESKLTITRSTRTFPPLHSIGIPADKPEPASTMPVMPIPEIVKENTPNANS